MIFGSSHHKVRPIFGIPLWICLVLAIAGCSSAAANPDRQSAIATAVVKTMQASARQTERAAPSSTPSLAPSPTATATSAPTRTEAPQTRYFPPGAVQVPILLYHHIAEDEQDSRYYISPETFEQQMTWLEEHGYGTITVSRLAEVIRNGGDLPLHPVVITFDDGNGDLYTEAFPIMQAHGMVGVAYLVNSTLDLAEIVTSAQVKELIDSGWEIGSHSATHPELTGVHDQLETEIAHSRRDLQERFQVPVNSFSYPFGVFDDTVYQAVLDSGYTSAVWLGEGTWHDLSSIYYLQRIEIEHQFSMEDFISLMPWK